MYNKIYYAYIHDKFTNLIFIYKYIMNNESIQKFVLVIARRGGQLPSNWRGAKGGACAARPEANYLVIGRPGVAITN